MRTTRLVQATSVLLLGFFALARPAAAVPILGGQLFYTGGNVTVEILAPTAAFISNLYLYDDPSNPAVLSLGQNTDVGATTMFDPSAYGFALNQELIFGIDVTDTMETYFMGPGTRNPDGEIHAGVDDLGMGTFDVGFEDLFGGGDRDYNDSRFLFTGGLSTSVAEPGTLALLGLGLAGIGFVRRRRQAA